jgi:hypothetical protein
VRGDEQDDAAIGKRDPPGEAHVRFGDGRVRRFAGVDTAHDRGSVRGQHRDPNLGAGQSGDLFGSEARAEPLGHGGAAVEQSPQVVEEMIADAQVHEGVPADQHQRQDGDPDADHPVAERDGSHHWRST